jgi:hypothetical protein
MIEERVCLSTLAKELNEVEEDHDDVRVEDEGSEDVIIYFNFGPLATHD